MSWADSAAQQANEADEKQGVNEALKLRYEKIKDRAAPSLVNQLADYLTEQVNKYNRQRGKKEIQVRYQAFTQRGLNFYGDEIELLRLDHKCPPLKLTYFRDSHILHWECAAGRGDFILQVDGDTNVPYFEDSSHERVDITQIGERVLSKWQESQL